MSLSYEENITCPCCRNTVSFITWDSVNVDLDSAIKERGLLTTPYTIICPHCKTRLFVNMDKNIPHELDDFTWVGQKNTVCDGCIFSETINFKGDGCCKHGSRAFLYRIILGVCRDYKKDTFSLSCNEELVKSRTEKAKEINAKITEEYAIHLVNDFIQEKLNGELHNLISFDFNSLKDDDKYGGYNAPEKSHILKALMTLIFSDTWNNISYHAFDIYEYEVEMVNTFTMLLGYPIADTFRSLNIFRPSSEILDRIYNFYRLSHTIGNYVVMPGGILSLRKHLPRKFRYIDAFFKAFKQAFFDYKSGNLNLVQNIKHNKKRFEKYNSEQGFTQMFHNLFLSSYIDSNGNPMSLFDGIWIDEKFLERERLFEAIEQYFNFCEHVIKERSVLLINKLNEVLQQSSQMAKIKEIEIEIPEEFTLYKTLRYVPEGTKTYTKITDKVFYYAQTLQIAYDDLFPFDKKIMNNDIRNTLDYNEKFIEVNTGKTIHNKNYIYYIIKGITETLGVYHTMVMHLEQRGRAIMVWATGDEKATTSIRDKIVSEYTYQNSLIPPESRETGKQYSYDKIYSPAIQMYMLDRCNADLLLPNHSLSEIRKLITYIIKNN